MEERTVLITGASRGLGLEFARQYAADGFIVLATTKSFEGSATLVQLCESYPSQVAMFPLDVSSEQSVTVAKTALQDRKIDILINNAGVWGGDRQTFGNMDYVAWLHAFEVNAIGPFRLIEAFRTNLARSLEKKVVTLTSEMGSIELGGHGAYAYRSSKAAANRIMRTMANDLRAEGILAMTIHPGWVRTDMGTADATLSPEESVSAIKAMIEKLDAQTSGRFVTLDGARLPW